MAGKSSPGAEPAERTLVITRVFDAPRNVVFQAWTKKEHLDRWCAPRGFTILDSEGELRPGGRWRCCMRSPDGVDHGGKTRLTLHQAIFESVESRDAHEGGWSECLDILSDYLAALRVQSGDR